MQHLHSSSSKPTVARGSAGSVLVTALIWCIAIGLAAILAIQLFT